MGLLQQSRTRVRASFFVAALVAPLVTGAPAGAAPKRITGKLSKPGFTVIALAPSGEARVARAPSGKFRLRPPARSVTLQLRAPDGIYAGPVVVGRQKRGKVSILGVRAGARLGRVRVRRGYAKLSRRLGKKSVDARKRARARRGVPIGAGRYGRVRSRRVRSPGPGDSDLDGIPDVLDVDDDGDRILDRLDRSSATRRARSAQGPDEQFGIHSRLTLYLPNTANANAAGLSDAAMDTALSTGGDLLLTVLPGDSLPNSPELDCGGSIQQPPRPEGLIYCRPQASGGIGTVGYGPPGVPPPPFPDCCDPDGDGLGTMRADSGPLGGPRTGMTLHHHATTEQIGTGDLMMERVVRGGAETAFLTALQYVFASVPAAKSFDDDGPAVPATVTYPWPPSNPGNRGNGFPVADGPDADKDVEVTLTFWRPQREAVPAWGESGWIDVGRLKYEVQVQESGLRCPQNAFTTAHPDLAPNTSGNPGFTDLQGDRPANSGNTFTYTLNLSRCLESNGFSFKAGDDRAFSFLAVNPNGPDNAQQGIWFKRE